MAEVDLKQIQNVELIILEQIKTICEKYKLKYFADSGTLLGIVRNNSFIPWDNDIDLVMPRKDYQKFIKIAEKELQYPYYLQTGYKDKGYFSGLIKIRKSDTTAILKSQLGKRHYNQGVFLDIFPLDNVINNKKLQKLQLRVIFQLKKILFYRNTKSFSDLYQNFFIKLILIIFSPLIFVLPQSFFYWLFDITGRWGNLKKTKYVDKVLFRGYYKQNKCKSIPAECYKDVIQTKFEDTTINIPVSSEKILTEFYGPDYLVPRQEPDSHGEIFFDLNNSYTKYLSHELEIE